MRMAHDSHQKITIMTSKITGNKSVVRNHQKDIMVMKKFEILRQLQKCKAETRSKHTGRFAWCRRVATNLKSVQSEISAKLNKSIKWGMHVCTNVWCSEHRWAGLSMTWSTRWVISWDHLTSWSGADSISPACSQHTSATSSVSIFAILQWLFQLSPSELFCLLWLSGEKTNTMFFLRTFLLYSHIVR